MINIKEVSQMSSIDKTMKFNFSEEPYDRATKKILMTTYDALAEKGYNPINQIVGYLLSGDSAYIRRYKDARTLIRKIERNENIEELVKAYLAEHKKMKQ